MTREGIKKILQTLGESLEKLRPLEKIPLAEFLKSPVSQDIARWNFYVVIQSCLDLGNHVISIKNYETPERYEDIVNILKKEKVISKNLAVSLQGMGGFRNLIAHGYFKIDLSRLYSYLKKLNDVEKFVKRLEPHLTK